MSHFIPTDENKEEPVRQQLIPAKLAALIERAGGETAPDGAVMEVTGKAAKKKDAPAKVPVIHTLDSLKHHLQKAIELEHSTIPPYLCALYSIKEGTNADAVKIIRSVVVEEMLHMVMAANILNAIGGSPSINTKEFIPKYPGPLPDIDPKFEVGLLKFCPAAVETFLRIELPDKDLKEPKAAHDFETIGQFYYAITQGLVYLNEQSEGAIFNKNRNQVTADEYYGSGGKLLAVHDIHDALLVIKEIVGQGEGVDGTIIDSDSLLFGQGIEYAHYFRFNEILQERYYCAEDKASDPPNGEKMPVDWKGVHNMRPNPKMADYAKGSPIWTATYEFNKTYMALLNNLHEACNGKQQVLREGLMLMYDLKYKAQALMALPAGKGETAGPSFEYVS